MNIRHQGQLKKLKYRGPFCELPAKQHCQTVILFERCQPTSCSLQQVNENIFKKEGLYIVLILTNLIVWLEAQKSVSHYWVAYTALIAELRCRYICSRPFWMCPVAWRSSICCGLHPPQGATELEHCAGATKMSPEHPTSSLKKCRANRQKLPQPLYSVGNTVKKYKKFTKRIPNKLEYGGVLSVLFLF